MIDIKSSSFLIIGLGTSGISTMKFLISQGCKNIFVWDDSLEQRDKAKLMGAEIFFKEQDIIVNYCFISPGINWDDHVISIYCKENNVIILTDIELFFQYLPKNTYSIGITGTNGKSTVASLVYHILSSAGYKAYLGGNFGIPILSLPIEEKVFYIIELSSFQLEQVKNIKLSKAVILNIDYDHLSRHKTMENYIRCKERIFSFSQEKILIIDDKFTQKIFRYSKNIITVSTKKKNSDIYFNKNTIYNNKINKIFKIPQYSHINLQNILAAYSILFDKVNVETYKSSLKSFNPLPFRQEYVGKIKNIIFINDSKATNFHASKYAVDLLKSKKIFWLVGGKIKLLPTNKDLLILKKVARIYTFGEGYLNLFKFFSSINKYVMKYYDICSSLQHAYKDALAEKEEVIILFSPSCSSFDCFKNYIERGEYFNSLVNSLMRKKS